MGDEERLKLIADGAVSVPEAQKITSLGRSLLYSMMERGDLRFCKIGKRRLIPRNELNRLLAESLVGVG